MVLDLLPYRVVRAGRQPGRWGWARYAHFLASLALVLALWYSFGYRAGDADAAGLYWLLGGNGLYYGSAIGLALVLRDNRAFCKYLCPIPVLQKLTSRFALLKVGGQAQACNDCGACGRACPMDIRVNEYIRSGRRVGSTECILCQTCINACPKGILKVSTGLDAGGPEWLRTGNGTGLEARQATARR